MGTNVLNSYRSFNYNFTLAALTRSQSNDPSTFDPNNPKIVIATTKGKSKNSINPSVNTPSVKSTQAQQSDTTNGKSIPNASNQSPSDDIDLIVNGNLYGATNAKAQQVEKQNQQNPGQFTEGQIGEFNKTSAGRFDMFIDNVDIKSTFTISNDQTMSMPFEIHFDIFEPYSMNGLIEAMQVSALAAGYPDYIACPYVLIIDFIGYPDGPGITDPKPINGSTRTFSIKIAGLDVSVNSEGTVYKLRAIPVGDKAFSDPIAKTKTKINGEGKTVGEILKNITTNINEQIKKDAISMGMDGKLTDTYEILFPEYDLNTGKVIGNSNKISIATFDDPGVSPSNVAMDDIDSIVNGYGATPISSKTPIKTSTPSTAIQNHSVQFDSGIPIPEIIAAVVKDSSFLTSIIKAFHAKGNPNKVVDQNKMVDYFIIIPQVLDKPGPINPDTNRPYCQYTYVVQPYKMVYNTVVPGTGRQVIDDKILRKNCLRNYNYFYTGLNVDIIDFKINFNTLFFEELPRAMGNTKELPSAGSAGNNNSVDVIKKSDTPQQGGMSNNPRPPQYYTENASRNNPGDLPNASSPGAESWKQIDKVMHDGVNKSVGLITGEISILGDPYYLTAGGSGTYLTKNNKFGSETGIGEAAKSAGEVLISLDFKNPIDIDDSTGFMQFDNNVIPYSGVYQVVEVRSEFKGGLFKQTLNLVRKPNQPQNSNQTPSILTQSFSAKPKKDAQVVADTAPESQPSAGTTNNGTLASSNNTVDLRLTGMIVNPDLSSNYRASINGLNLQSNLGLPASANFASNLLNIPAVNIANHSINANYNLANQLTPKALTNAEALGSSAINSVGAKINSALSPINAVDNAFNIATSQLSGLGGLLTSKISQSLPNLYSIIPNPQQLAQQLNVGNLTKTQMQNIPALEPKYGLADATWSGGNPVTNASAKSSITNPLGNVSQQTLVDQTANAARMNSGLSLLPTDTSQSREGLQLTIDNSLGNNSSQLDTSVVSNNNYGSKTNDSLSPLLSAMNK